MNHPERRRNHTVEPVEPTFRRFGAAAIGILSAVIKRDFRGAEHVPGEGGILVAANHISDADPLVLGNFLIAETGRYPRFLGKAEIWGWPVIGWLARACGQIKVERNSSHARDVVGAASAAIREGKCVGIYPEGGVTRDPDSWPMEPRTGVARIALETGCPVIPVAQWGPQELFEPFSHKVHIFPRRTMHVLAGPAVDLADLAEREITTELLDEASERVMKAITDLLVQLRGGTPPEVRYTWTPRGSKPGKSHA